MHAPHFPLEFRASIRPTPVLSARAGSVDAVPLGTSSSAELTRKSARSCVHGAQTDTQGRCGDAHTSHGDLLELPELLGLV